MTHESKKSSWKKYIELNENENKKHQILWVQLSMCWEENL